MGDKDFADADVISVFETLRTVIQIQVKFHTDMTSGWAVEQITKYKEQQKDFMNDISADREDDYTVIPWVISSCDDYEDDAKEMARENRVRLINGPEFARMIINSGLYSLDVE